MQAPDDTIKLEHQTESQESEGGEVEFVEENNENFIIDQDDTTEYYGGNVYTLDEIIAEERESIQQHLIQEKQVKLELADPPKQKYFLVPQCSVCGKICRNSSALNAHEKTHFDKMKEKNFECDLCGDSFSKKGMSVSLSEFILILIVFSLRLSTYELYPY